jgi:hypothetical protein
MTALFLVVLFAFASLAIDMGVAYTARTSSQHAADAAALAGAFTFVVNATAPDPLATAGSAAIAAARQNKVLGQAAGTNAAFTVQPSPCPTANTTNWVCVDVANRRVSVNVERTGASGISTYFARAAGWNSLNVATVATAEAGNHATGTHCLKPIYVPNTVIAPASDKTIQTACNAGHRLFDQFMQVSSYAQSRYDQLLSFRPLNAHDALSPSQYYTADFGSGAQTVRCTISKCLNDTACNVDAATLRKFAGKCGDSVSTQNGVQTGPVIQGFNDLIVGDTFDPQTGIITTASGPSATSPQLITAPVWDDCVPPYTTKGMPSGKQTFPVIGFLTVFVNPGGVSPQGDITAYLVNASSCAGTPDTNGSTGPYGVPVRLIQQTD